LLVGAAFNTAPSPLTTSRHAKLFPTSVLPLAAEVFTRDTRFEKLHGGRLDDLTSKL
jgi:hypothetical protein